MLRCSNERQHPVSSKFWEDFNLKKYNNANGDPGERDHRRRQSLSPEQAAAEDPRGRADPRLKIRPVLLERDPPEVPGFEDAARLPERREKCVPKDVKSALQQRVLRQRHTLQTLQTVGRRGHAGEAEDRIDPRENLKDSDPNGRHATAGGRGGLAAKLLRLRPGLIYCYIILFLNKRTNEQGCDVPDGHAERGAVEPVAAPVAQDGGAQRPVVRLTQRSSISNANRCAASRRQGGLPSLALGRLNPRSAGLELLHDGQGGGAFRARVLIGPIF
ncbi:hypothetical protein CEUSTIGMA_g13613.t1 [Chlamydomonas eustigma]|uniref:Uncharacterized protein n=1 Tax=Chlamydomonas eustigma TaxID=1157962 RepID=A0A250XTB2_9CHLO|nr:hypothetical protein CEUSTIGMA_g13613.t1 [Chlamydomonas eustigma]|eukprot:GAX86199.1 hypothetical protein CEUSTIGMA_g13613.t1 [Chlamydomonas eustigma]